DDQKSCVLSQGMVQLGRNATGKGQAGEALGADVHLDVPEAIANSCSDADVSRQPYPACSPHLAPGALGLACSRLPDHSAWLSMQSTKQAICGALGGPIMGQFGCEILRCAL